MRGARGDQCTCTMPRQCAAVVALLLVAFVTHVSAGGIFELKLRGFENKLGVNSVGGCCSGSKTASGVCVNSECATKFRVCLMHFQRQIDDHPLCTFGETTTPVLGGNSFQVQERANATFVNPMVFPFNFSWPGTYSLVIEAWHEKPGADAATTFEARHTLVHRMTKQGWLDVGSDWSHEERRTRQHAVLFDFRVQCDRFYYGHKCNIICKCSASLFGHYECLQNGTRKCLPGWTSEYCTKATCAADCHEEHGYCNEPNECTCRSGWKGKFCDVCERYPGCRNGTCSAAWGCDCLEGWGGLFCNQDLNFCTNHRPCKNGGTCYNTGQGSYTCECPVGFNGTDCEIEEGGCARHPCTNGGTCRDTGHNFMCVCPRGWSGHRCETAAETCDDRPCQNGGRCEDGAAGYRCHCPAGYKGTNCEQRNTFCQPDPCRNGGNCVNDDYGHRCVCPVGFAGRNCERNVNDCAVNPCLNGGTCHDQVNAFSCVCVPGFVGAVCQMNVNDCLTNPCANGGTCHDLVNDFTCTCRLGFTGKDCSVDIDECAGQLCQNGGVCADRVGTFECRCPAGLVGDLCQFEGVVPEWARPVSGRVQSPTAAADETMPSEHVVLISTLSVSVPALVLVSIAAILCMKYRRRRAAEKDDDEARRQNAENASAGKRHFEDTMIVNALDYPTGKVKNVDDSGGGGGGGYSLEATKTHKQLNIDPARRASGMLNTSSSSAYDKVDFEAACRTSPPLKVCVDGGGPSYGDAAAAAAPAARVCPNRTGVYVIDDHLAGASLATEVYATEV